MIRIILVLLFFLLVILNCNCNHENFQGSNEALQNIASVYNNNQMKVTNLDVLNNLNVKNGLNIDGMALLNNSLKFNKDFDKLTDWSNNNLLEFESKRTDGGVDIIQMKIQKGDGKAKNGEISWRAGRNWSSIGFQPDGTVTTNKLEPNELNIKK